MTVQMLEVVVREMSVEAEDVVSLVLSPLGKSTLPAHTAGAHIDLHVAGFVRQYSLCNRPEDENCYRISVLKDGRSRGGSVAVHALRRGDALRISSPRNHFALAPTASRSLLFAGGIGITPLISMAQSLHLSGQPFDLHYCTRSRSKTAFLQRIQASGFAQSCQFHFDDGPPQQRLTLENVLAQPLPGAHIYTCGPNGFMEAVLGTARASGWPEAQLHSEFFAGTHTHPANDAAFEVVLACSGQVVAVPAHLTVAQALEQAGAPIAMSCEQGVCGTCLTRILEGEPDHRDMYLTEAERLANDQFLPCCSRSHSPRLVLDL